VYVASLPADVTESILASCLRDVREIRGSLFIQDNPYLVSSSIFVNLQSVESVSLLNNPALVDARMPSILNVTGDIVVTGCHRLCPERHPFGHLPANSTSSPCVTISAEVFLGLQGNVQEGDLLMLEDLLLRIYTSVYPSVCFSWVRSCFHNHFRPPLFFHHALSSVVSDG
jgi:hypothetical protein